MANNRPDDRHRDPAGAADHDALAISARRAEIGAHRCRSGGNAPVSAGCCHCRGRQGRRDRAVGGGEKIGYTRTSGRRAVIRDESAAALKQIQKIQPQMTYLNVLREVLPPNAIVTDELSQVGFASWYGFPVYEPRTFISSGYQGTLGSGFPTALGAKVAHPSRPVVAITGDGGFMFGVQELATAVQFNIGVVVLVFNNNSYGNVRRDQRERFDGRVVAADLVNPDFVKLAESFGVGAARVTSPDHFRPALEKALAHGGPYLIDIEVPRDSEVSPWAFIHPPKP